LIRSRLRSRHARRIAGGAVAVAVIVATFVFVLPRIADYRDVWAVVKELSWEQVALLLAVTALNLATYAPPWQAALPGLSFRNALVLSQASSASTYIAPGGPAVGVALSYGMLRAWGFPGPAVTLAVALTGIWNQFMLLGLPSVALVLLTVVGERHPLLQTVALVGLVIFIAAAGSYAAGLSSRRLARWAGNLTARVASWALRVFRRGPVSWTGETFATFRAQAVGLLRRRWHVLTLATLAGHLTVFVVLLTSLRVFGVSPGEVSGIEAFAAWSLIRLLGSIPITPGGLGVVELGLTTALVGFGGGNAEVVTAVLVYRFLTIVPTLVLGLLLGATWKRHRPRPQAIEGGAA
jgi:putative heme transporter